VPQINSRPAFGVGDSTDQTNPSLLTVTEAARLLRCSRSHLYRLMRGKYPTLPPFPRIALGTRILVRREALSAWLLLLERQERQAAYASGLSTHYLDEDYELFAGA
jgi:excisionase family DNA binding protein